MITPENWLLWVLGVVLGAVIIARLITSTVRYATTKQCPQCDERVKAGALKCRYCGYTFEEAAADRRT